MNSAITKCIYVDLSNLYGGTSEIFEDGVYIDFSTLMPLLDDVFGGIHSFKVYGAYMQKENKPKDRTEAFVKAQHEFFNSARIPGVHFGQGKISHGQEKGVDMQLGVDMVNDAYQKKFSDYILFSGDADFQYPVKIIKSLGFNFHYCAFANRFAKNFAFDAWKKLVIDYNKLFVNNKAGYGRLPKKLVVKDIYKVSSVKTRSILS